MSTNDMLRVQINERIATLKTAEITVKEQLGLVALEILNHYSENSDGTLVVNLLNVLTPKNKEAAGLFFETFINVTETGAKAGSKKQRAKIDVARELFLTSGVGFWEWCATEIEPMKAKDKDFKALLTTALKQAMNGIHTKTRDQNGLSKQEVAFIVLGEISVDEMLAALVVNDDAQVEQDAEPYGLPDNTFLSSVAHPAGNAELAGEAWVNKEPQA